MKFDVIMPTLNSVSRIGEDVLRKVLERICAQIPLGRLLAVDDGSKDGTIEVLKEFGAVFINGPGSLGKAREVGIQEAKTDWFYFIDDDNLIPPHFHEEMWKHVDENVGMVFAQAVAPYDDYMTRYERIIGEFKRKLRLRDAVERRGYTGATLLRKRAVEGIRIPAVGRQEDYYIKEYCERRNWKVKYAFDVMVLHFTSGLASARTQYLEGYGMAVVGATSKARMVRSWLLTYPKCLFAFPYVRKRSLLTNVPRMYYIKYKGYMNARHKRKK